MNFTPNNPGLRLTFRKSIYFELNYVIIMSFCKSVIDHVNIWFIPYKSFKFNLTIFLNK